MNIDLIYLFYECADSNIVSCADDTTPYVCGKYTEKIQYIYIYIYIYIYNELFQIRKRTISNLILKVSRFLDYQVNKS